MKCEDIKERCFDFLTGRLDAEARKTFEAHLKKCKACRLEMEKMGVVWKALDELPEEEPSPALRSRFYAMLEHQKQELGQSEEKTPWPERVEAWLGLWWPRRPVVQFALSVLLLLSGLFIGSRMQVGAHRNGEVAQLREEIQDMRQTVTLSLLNQTSSIERLRGVSWSTRVDRPTESLLTALLNTLNSDPSVNVRLATVDALILFSNRPGVREALIESLSHQTSPLVQISVIDLLFQIREKRSLETLRKLIQDEQIDQSVRQHVEERIEELS